MVVDIMNINTFRMQYFPLVPSILVHDVLKVAATPC